MNILNVRKIAGRGRFRITGRQMLRIAGPGEAAGRGTGKEDAGRVCILPQPGGR